jgi:hypothetical protein
MRTKRRAVKKRRPKNHAKLYQALKLPAQWVTLLSEYPDPLAVLPILLAARSIASAQEICEAIEDLADAMLEENEGAETEALVTVQ